MDERCPKGKPSVMRSELCMYKSLRSYCLKKPLQKYEILSNLSTRKFAISRLFLFTLQTSQ